MLLHVGSSAKTALAFLTEQFPGPPGIANYVRGFRFLLFFGVACVAENRYPELTRCWHELDKLFMSDPRFDDSSFVQSWILKDFPFGPEGQTVLDYFEAFCAKTDLGPQLKPFIDQARKSRLGLYQDMMRTKKVAKFRELFTGRVISAFPSVVHYEKGEILLVRTIEIEGQVFLFGDPKGFPKEKKRTLETMVEDKLIYFFDAEKTVPETYETFMRLAGPYWMSCVTKNDSVPILEPNHYCFYLDESAQ